MTTAEAALAYQSLGFPVLPLRGKEPHRSLLRDLYGSSQWASLREPASKGEINEWYRRDPEAGVGIVTGGPTGLAVIDFDGDLPTGLRLPVTPIARSGGSGLHVYVRGLSRIPKSKLPWDGDLLTDGAYVVAPPSLHPSGSRYQWLVAPEGLGDCAVPEATPIVSSFELLGLEINSPEHAVVEPHLYDYVYDCSRPADTNDLRAWDRDDTFVGAAIAHFGIPTGSVGTSFRCVLPDHEEDRPSASLFRETRHGTVVYHDWHRDGRFYTLAEVFAARVSGQVRKLKGPELATWKRRLLVETGFVQPARVSMPPLPSDAPAAARALYFGLRCLYECRWTRERAAAPFTEKFAAAWCSGIAPNEVLNARRWLAARGIIVRAGRCGRTPLWLPGDGQPMTGTGIEYLPEVPRGEPHDFDKVGGWGV